MDDNMVEETAVEAAEEEAAETITTAAKAINRAITTTMAMVLTVDAVAVMVANKSLIHHTAIL